MRLVTSRFGLCVVFAGRLAASGVGLVPRLVLLCFWVLLVVLLVGWVVVCAFPIYTITKGLLTPYYRGLTRYIKLYSGLVNCVLLEPAPLLYQSMTSLGLWQEPLPGPKEVVNAGAAARGIKNGITFFIKIKSSSPIKYEHIDPL